MNKNEIDEEVYVSLINMFLIHYKRVNGINEILKIDDIEDITKTNNIMEEFYYYIEEYKENEKKDNKMLEVYDLNIDLPDRIYCLTINGKPIKISETFISLLIYMLKFDWSLMEWKIIYATKK
jgi:hypothetical protein